VPSGFFAKAVRAIITGLFLGQVLLILSFQWSITKGLQCILLFPNFNRINKLLNKARKKYYQENFHIFIKNK